MDKFSNIGNQDLDLIENIYQDYIANPASVEDSWRHFFEGFELAHKNFSLLPKELGYNEPIQKEFHVINLIHGYRQRGHLFTRTNPVRTRRKYSPTLDIENFGLSSEDLETTFHAGNLIGLSSCTLKEIIEHLEHTYCESVGVEYLYMRHPEVVKWLQQRMETILDK